MTASFYRFTCACGAVNETPHTIGRCWDCNRAFELQWAAEYKPTRDTKVVEMEKR